MTESERKDLIILVPDNDVKYGIAALLSRFESLNIKPISFDIFVHPEHDPGVYHKATEFLRPFINLYHYALVFFDHHGSGQEANSLEQLEAILKKQIERNGWEDRIEIIIFEPELEAWIWTENSHVAKTLGWNNYNLLKNWLIQQNLWEKKLLKPQKPKEALEALLKEKKIPRSSSIYNNIAQNVNFARCQDQSFAKLKKILINWFPKG